MGLFNRKQKKQLRSIIKEYYGGNIRYFVWNYTKGMYDIPEVRNAIECVADIFSAIPMYHKRVDKNGNVTYFEDSLARVLTIKPNELQNATQFWKTIITQLLVENNVFIEPIYNYLDGNLKDLYPLPVKDFDFELENGAAYVQFYDAPKTPAKKYNLGNIIYLSRFCKLIGGEKSNLGLYEKVLKSLGEQIVNVASPKKVRALLQGKGSGLGQLKDRDKEGTMKEVQANFDENVNGIAYLDAVWQVTPINWQENDVNQELMKFIVNEVYNYFRINDTIINNKANEVEFEMFVNNSIKPLAKQIEQEFTSKLFTQREIEVGHRIELDTFALSVSTLQSKANLFNVASRQGIMNIDEMRELIGQPPLANGLGKMYRVTGDTINLEKVDEYQAAQKGVIKSVSAEDVSHETNSDDINNSNKEGQDGETK